MDHLAHQNHESFASILDAAQVTCQNCPLNAVSSGFPVAPWDEFPIEIQLRIAQFLFERVKVSIRQRNMPIALAYAKQAAEIRNEIFSKNPQLNGRLPALESDRGI